MTCRLPVVIAAWCLLSAGAVAHPVPASQARLELEESGKYQLRLRCDVSALVMQSTPGHLGDEGWQLLQSLPDEELAARVEDEKRSLQFYLHLAFAGVRNQPTEITFPALELVRQGAAHGVAEPQGEILLQGTWSSTAGTLQITFPKSLNQVELEVWRGDRRLQQLRLGPGVSSGELAIGPAVPENPPKNYDFLAVWFCGGLVLYLLWRHWPGKNSDR